MVDQARMRRVAVRPDVGLSRSRSQFNPSGSPCPRRNRCVAVTLPADATVLSISAPATLPLDVPVLFASRRFPVFAVGIPAFPRLDVSTTTKSLESPVMNARPGEVLVPPLIPVIPIQLTPLYSATFNSYSVVPENIGVTEVSAAQLRQTRMALASHVLLVCWA